MTESMTALSFKAGKLVTELACQMSASFRNPNKSSVQASINKLAVRLVFCWSCDCAGLFVGKGRFYDYLKNTPTKYWRWALPRLFLTLDTPASQRGTGISFRGRRPFSRCRPRPHSAI